MAEIHKITKDGESIFPATTTDAVVHPTIKSSVTGLMNDYNVSSLFPSHSLSGTNRYTLSEAAELLDKVLEETQKGAGVRMIFVNDSGKLEVWEFQGGRFTNQLDWLPCSANTISDIPVQDLTELVRRAETAATDAKNSADIASQSGDLAQYAKTQGDYAKEQGGIAKTQATAAKTNGDYAKEQGDYAKNIADGYTSDVEELRKNALLKTAQTLTAEEKEQVQENLGISGVLGEALEIVRPSYFLHSGGLLELDTPISGEIKIGFVQVEYIEVRGGSEDYTTARYVTIPMSLYKNGIDGNETSKFLIGDHDNSIFSCKIVSNDSADLSVSHLVWTSELKVSDWNVKIKDLYFFTSKNTGASVIQNGEARLMTASMNSGISTYSAPNSTTHYNLYTTEEGCELNSSLLGTIPSDLRQTVREVTVISKTNGKEKTWKLTTTSEPGNFFNPKSWMSVKEEIEHIKCCLGSGDYVLEGLKVAVFGDLYSCSPNSWAEEMAKEFGWTELAVYSQPEATLGRNGETKSIVDLIEKLKDLNWTPDLVVITPFSGLDVRYSHFGSFKDIGTHDTMGLIPTKANKSTVCGGIRYISEIVHTIVPDAKLFFTTQVYTSPMKPGDTFVKGSGSIERAELDEAIIKGGRRFQYQTIDMSGSGIHPWKGKLQDKEVKNLITSHMISELRRLFKKTI